MASQQAAIAKAKAEVREQQDAWVKAQAEARPNGIRNQSDRFRGIGR